MSIQQVPHSSADRVFMRVHDLMRNGDGLQPADALDELLKFLFLVRPGRAGGMGLIQRRPGNGAVGEEDEHHAKRLRTALDDAIRIRQDAGDGVLGLEPFRLSNATLCRVADALGGLDQTAPAVDLKGAALRVFISSHMRKGLGVYLTPDPVVQAVVEVVRPGVNQRVLDPACGTGGFLLHTVFRWRKEAGEADQRVWGIERNPRLARVASLNLAPLVGDGFAHHCADALMGWDEASHPDWIRPGHFDVVMTNPPFGVTVSGDALARAGLSIAGSSDQPVSRIGSEVAFVERSLDLLRPGGVLAIVLPNSVLTNARLASARQAIDQKGRLLAVLSLPPETFAATGTQTATSVLFFLRRGEGATSGLVAGEVYTAACENVGYDASGHPRADSDLLDVARAVREVVFEGGTPRHGQILRCPPGQEMASLAAAQMQRPVGSRVGEGAVPLSDLATLIRTGRTPPRAEYADEGTFILKVGNLTGNGIDWFARDRNHISDACREKRQKSRLAEQLFVQPGDIVLTSSAHQARYIAKKVDIIDSVPDFVRQPVSFVGELMLVRPDPSKIDPYRLLAFLRCQPAQAALRAMVRGQTAHLMPKDMVNLMVPLTVLQGPKVGELADLLRAESTGQFESLLRRKQLADRLVEVFSPVDG